ncbi:MAG TPA: glycosyltransferase [Pyrinomonadaceae bacterium]|nr:glycosyltransferase [Pyrinomonadaceae bacterium]
MFERVLILSASVGAGHVRAAQALEKAIVQMGAAQEVRHVDTLDYTNRVFRKLYSQAYLEMVNGAPEVLGWLYDYLDQPWKNERRRLALNRLNTRRFVKLLKQYQPEMTICTHFLPAEIISWLKAKKQLSSRQAIVVTDFDIHAMWLCHHYEQYFVALDETRVHMEKLGIPSEKITVSGIPIDPVFAEKKDKRTMREKHGLIADGTTILVSAGGFGVGSMEHVIKSLLELQHATQVVAISGRNEELRRRLLALVSSNPPESRVTVKVVGYTTEMDEYMAAADFMLGKPGGLTTSEAFARGLVLVIVNPIPGQEERNSDHLLEEGVGIRCNNLPTLAHKIDQLLADPERLAMMRENVARLSRPRAAYEIVTRLLALREEIRSQEGMLAPADA